MNRKQKKNQEPNLETYKPVKVLDVEVSRPLPSISSRGANDQRVYHQAQVLVRLHTNPLGLLLVKFNREEISPQDLAEQIWAKFGQRVNRHLLQDGFSELQSLPLEGVPAGGALSCLRERQALLDNAPMASIIISTRERVQSLSNALNSVLALNYPAFEVILVDNAPKTDQTHEFFNFIQPRFLRNNINLRYVREDTPGLAIAHNRGLQHVRSPYVAFTDDDVTVDKNWLVELIHGFDAAPSVACVTGLVVPAELETPPQLLFEEYGGFVKGFDQQIFDLEGHRQNHPLYPYSPGHFGTGASMAFKTELLKRSGGFDPALGIGTPTLGADDLAAFFQILIDGNRLVYQPSAIIYHQHRRTYEALLKQMYGYGTGLTVFLLKFILKYPRLFMDVAPKIPLGLKYAFAPDSPKNRNKSPDYPSELEWIERKGMLYGPIAYIISRRRYRKQTKEFSEMKSRPDFSVSPHYLVSGWPDDRAGDKSTKEI